MESDVQAHEWESSCEADLKVLCGDSATFDSEKAKDAVNSLCGIAQSLASSTERAGRFCDLLVSASGQASEWKKEGLLHGLNALFRSVKAAGGDGAEASALNNPLLLNEMASRLPTIFDTFSKSELKIRVIGKRLLQQWTIDELFEESVTQASFTAMGMVMQVMKIPPKKPKPKSIAATGIPGPRLTPASTAPSQIALILEPVGGATSNVNANANPLPPKPLHPFFTQSAAPASKKRKTVVASLAPGPEVPGSARRGQGAGATGKGKGKGKARAKAKSLPPNLIGLGSPFPGSAPAPAPTPARKPTSTTTSPTEPRPNPNSKPKPNARGSGKASGGVDVEMIDVEGELESGGGAEPRTRAGRRLKLKHKPKVDLEFVPDGNSSEDAAADDHSESDSDSEFEAKSKAKAKSKAHPNPGAQSPSKKPRFFMTPAERQVDDAARAQLKLKSDLEEARALMKEINATKKINMSFWTRTRPAGAGGNSGGGSGSGSGSGSNASVDGKSTAIGSGGSGSSGAGRVLLNEPAPLFPPASITHVGFVKPNTCTIESVLRMGRAAAPPVEPPAARLPPLRRLPLLESARLRATAEAEVKARATAEAEVKARARAEAEVKARARAEAEPQVELELEPKPTPKPKSRASKLKLAKKKAEDTAKGLMEAKTEAASPPPPSPSRSPTGAQLQWCARYAPKSPAEVCGSSNMGRAVNISGWLEDWKDATVERIDSGDLCNLTILTGPVGCGKSALVYACAVPLGFGVIEVNAASQRVSGRELAVLVGEATQSRSVAVAGTGGGTGITAGTVASIDVDGDSTSADSSATRTLLLVEDVGTVQLERGFIAALTELIRTAKIPVILACNGRLSEKYALEQLQVPSHVIALRAPSADDIVSHIQYICRTEAAAPSLDDDRSKAMLRVLARLFNCDLRACINAVELMCLGFEMGAGKSGSSVDGWTMMCKCFGVHADLMRCGPVVASFGACNTLESGPETDAEPPEPELELEPDTQTQSDLDPEAVSEAKSRALSVSCTSVGCVGLGAGAGMGMGMGMHGDVLALAALESLTQWVRMEPGNQAGMSCGVVFDNFLRGRDGGDGGSSIQLGAVSDSLSLCDVFQTPWYTRSATRLDVETLVAGEDGSSASGSTSAGTAGASSYYQSPSKMRELHLLQEISACTSVLAVAVSAAGMAGGGSKSKTADASCGWSVDLVPISVVDDNVAACAEAMVASKAVHKCLSKLTDRWLDFRSFVVAQCADTVLVQRLDDDVRQKWKEEETRAVRRRTQAAGDEGRANLKSRAKGKGKGKGKGDAERKESRQSSAPQHEPKTVPDSEPAPKPEAGGTGAGAESVAPKPTKPFIFPPSSADSDCDFETGSNADDGAADDIEYDEADSDSEADAEIPQFDEFSPRRSSRRRTQIVYFDGGMGFERIVDWQSIVESHGIKGSMARCFIDMGVE